VSLWGEKLVQIRKKQKKEPETAGAIPGLLIVEEKVY
jgi:hypothetical protein